MKRLNILLSSTRQWNPGDEFIRYGVKSLLRQILGAEHNWLLWNRNPDLFVDRWRDARLQTTFLTNSQREPVLDLVDLVVFAGSPEWTGPAVERIFRELLRYPRLPVLILGVGSGGPGCQLTAVEREVLRRDNVLVTTRSAELAAELNATLGLPKAIPLPCPALFCNGIDSKATAEPPNRNKIGLIVQSSTVANQAISEDLTQAIITNIRRADPHQELEIIGFYTDEFMRFSRLKLGRTCIYSYEPADLLQQLARYSAVVSTRLHGALAALSCQVPAFLLADTNAYRIRSTQGLFGELLPVLSPATAIQVAGALEGSSWLAQHAAIGAFKEQTAGRYLELLRSFLTTQLPHVTAGSRDV